MAQKYSLKWKESKMEYLINIGKFFIFLLVLKSLIIGSEFNFKTWWVYRNKYTDWYFNRDTFYIFLSKEKGK